MDKKMWKKTWEEVSDTSQHQHPNNDFFCRPQYGCKGLTEEFLKALFTPLVRDKRH